MSQQRDLYTQYFERFAFPLLDRLAGTRITKRLAELIESEQLEPAEIWRRQNEKLGRAIAYTREQSAFYTEFWRTRQGVPSAYPALDGLPVVRKADLAAAPDAFPLLSYRGRVISSQTSGSTGSPMTFHRSIDQESWFWALRFRMWRWAGYHPGDPYLTINLNTRAQWKKRLQDHLFRCAFLTFNADNQDSQRIVEVLAEKNILYLTGFSSSLFVLAEYMNTRGLANPGVQGITSTGDTLYPHYRDVIEKAFGVHVLDYYGAGGEGVHVASQCPKSGTRYHIHPENAVLEILGPDGPVAPGTAGRIVVTQLDNEAMPLVRYDLEDVAVAAPEGSYCECGRSLPLLERIDGRVPDLISVADGSYLVPHFFVVVMKQLQTVHRYQAVQTEVDRMTMRLVERSGASRAEIETTIRNEVDKATRGQLATDFEWVDKIPLSGLGKRRLIVSEISRARLGRSPETLASEN